MVTKLPSFSVSDYAGVMRTMGLPTMHHSTWDKLVSCLGTHVERLAELSCEQVRADISSNCNQWAASFGLLLNKRTSF